jgi:hypothetical protein
MRRIATLVIACALASCARKAPSSCAAWVERSLACDDDAQAMSDDERGQGKALLEQVCDDVMRGEPPSGVESPETIAAMKAEIACGAKRSCDEFRACERAFE